MHVLIVDNGTIHMPDIIASLNEHSVTVRPYEGHMDDAHKYDAVVLSGSSSHDPKDKQHHHRWYQKELEFIRHTNTPVIGICIGFELISLAFGGELVDLGYKVTDNRKVEFLKNRFVPFWEAGKHIVYEAHHWSVQAVDKASLKVIAHSDFGIEAVHHTKQPIIGMQFHPEVRENTQKLLDKLVIWETLLESARVETA